MEKENLDNLFRESLDELSQTPDPKVWDRIQATLDRKAKRQRKAIPLWWQVGGAAAALALFIYFLIPNSEKLTIPAVDPVSENPVDNISIDPVSPENEAVSSPAQEAIVIQREDNSSITRDTYQDQGTASYNGVKSAEAGGIVPSNAQSEQPTADPRLSDVAADQLESKTQDAPADAEREQLVTPKLEEAVATSLDESARNEGPEKEGSEAAIASEMDLEQERAYKELLSEPEEDLLQGGKISKWAVGPSVAPVYFNGAGGGSPIDPAFASNDKSGNLNMSYGLQVSYQLNKRWQLRSGLHKVDFGYNTNDIVFTSSLQTSSASNLENIDFAPTSDFLVVESQKAAPVKADAAIRTEVTARNPAREGTMIQEFGYMEIPLEINYALIDRTFGVNLISGISSMFLVDNSVSLESDLGTTEVGEANNVNNINFSANFGIGFQYKLNQKIDMQVEPLLKYQLNTFSNTAGEFRPYSIGVYSGIRYKF